MFCVPPGVTAELNVCCNRSETKDACNAELYFSDVAHYFYNVVEYKVLFVFSVTLVTIEGCAFGLFIIINIICIVILHWQN